MIGGRRRSLGLGSPRRDVPNRCQLPARRWSAVRNYFRMRVGPDLVQITTTPHPAFRPAYSPGTSAGPVYSSSAMMSRMGVTGPKSFITWSSTMNSGMQRIGARAIRIRHPPPPPLHIKPTQLFDDEVTISDDGMVAQSDEAALGYLTASAVAPIIAPLWSFRRPRSLAKTALTLLPNSASPLGESPRSAAFLVLVPSSA